MTNETKPKRRPVFREVLEALGEYGDAERKFARSLSPVVEPGLGSPRQLSAEASLQYNRLCQLILAFAGYPPVFNAPELGAREMHHEKPNDPGPS